MCMLDVANGETVCVCVLDFDSVCVLDVANVEIVCVHA